MESSLMAHVAATATSARHSPLGSSAPPARRPVAEFVNRIIHGDCIQVIATMPDTCVDLVVTDPPYAARYRDRSDRIVANDDTTSWLKPAFAQIVRVLKNNRFCVSFYGWHKVDTFMAAWRAAGLRPRAHFVWIKRYASGQNLAAYCHEQAYLLCKGEPPKPSLVLRDVLEWRYTGNRYHPTQKPLMALLSTPDENSPNRRSKIPQPLLGGG